jgi:signal transduction histidine kinase
MQVFTSLLVLGIFSAVYIITDINTYKKRKVENMKSLAHVLGLNSLSTLQFQDNEEAKKILGGLQNNVPEIFYASIVDSSGNIFASYTRPGTDALNLPVKNYSEDFVYTDHELMVSNNITDNNHKRVGKIILELELSELKQLTQTRLKLVAIILPFALGASFLIAILIQTYISRRLLHVVNTMKAVKETGDYTHSIKDDGSDEISTLINVFNTLMQQVMESQQRKDEFIGIASHELKTPLTTIKGYIELLNAMEEREPNKQFVQKALNNTNKLESLIKDLLDVSKIQSGQLKLNKEKFDLDALLDETLSSFQMVNNTHVVNREGNFNHQFIHADKQRLEQVLFNLLSNAVKYSPGKTKIIVYSNLTPSSVIIEVKDFGMGIPKEELENIFERFYRTKDVTRHIAGFGLGLYICRDIISRHGGKIWAEAAEKGAIFFISLPINNISEDKADEQVQTLI